MSRDMTLIAVGLLVIVIPYTGFPSAWRTLFLVVCGAIVAIIGFLMRGQTLSNKPQKKPEQHASFQESVRPAQEPSYPQTPAQPMSDIRPQDSANIE